MCPINVHTALLGFVFLVLHFFIKGLVELLTLFFKVILHILEQSSRCLIASSNTERNTVKPLI